MAESAGFWKKNGKVIALIVVLVALFAGWWFFIRKKPTNTPEAGTPNGGGSGGGSGSAPKPPIPNIQLIQPTGGLTTGVTPTQATTLLFTPIQGNLLAAQTTAVSSTDANGNVVTDCEVVYGNAGAGLTWCGQELADLKATANCTRNQFTNKLTCN